MHRILVAVFIVSVTLFFVTATSAHAQPGTSTQLSEDRRQAVSEWFAKYDQIRCDAEMPLGDKLKYGTAVNKLLKSGGSLSESTRAFIEKMVTKYSAAIAALNATEVLPETKELQEGYTEYFTEMERSFSNCLKATEMTESERETQSIAKEKLEALNQRNKTIDAELRKQFSIAKHKHAQSWLQLTL